MIIEVAGDITLTKAQALAHGIAPHDHFNNGLAHTLREAWPAMAKDFRHYCHQHNPHCGSLWTWSGPGMRIINLLTQEPAPSEHSHPGKASLSHVRHCLDALRKELLKENIQSLALPRLATGLGGLDWNDVYALIKEKLGDLDVKVFVYITYHPKQQAKESV